MSPLILLALQVPAANAEKAWAYNAAHGGQTMLVMIDGKNVFERYGNGGAADHPQMLASGSKSFVGVAAMAAVQDGLIRLDDPACESLTEWKADPQKSKITYRQLLSMSSGLTAGERGAARRMKSWKEIVASPMESAPGTHYVYGPYHINAFGLALERKLKGETFEAYLKRRILDPLKMTVDWRMKCADGHPQLAGGAYVTARDWAKFGRSCSRTGRASSVPNCSSYAPRPRRRTPPMA